MTSGDPHPGHHVALSDQELGHNRSSEQKPHSQAGQYRHGAFTDSSVQKRFDHGQVSLQTKARYRLSRAVNISIEESCDEPAGNLPKYPVVSTEVIMNPECKRKQEQ